MSVLQAESDEPPEFLRRLTLTIEVRRGSGHLARQHRCTIAASALHAKGDQSNDSSRDAENDDHGKDDDDHDGCLSTV